MQNKKEKRCEKQKDAKWVWWLFFYKSQNLEPKVGSWDRHTWWRSKKTYLSIFLIYCSLSLSHSLHIPCEKLCVCIELSFDYSFSTGIYYYIIFVRQKRSLSGHVSFSLAFLTFWVAILAQLGIELCEWKLIFALNFFYGVVSSFS